MANMNILRKTAQAALRAEYGFAPALRDITLLEASGDRTYILFKVNDWEYEFNSYSYRDGTVWVGDGHLKKTAKYKWSVSERCYIRHPVDTL